MWIHKYFLEKLISNNVCDFCLLSFLCSPVSESPNGLVFRFRDCSTPVPSALSDPSQEQQRTTVRQSVEIGILKNFTPAAARTSLGVHVNGPWGGTSLDVAAAGRKLIIKVQLALSLPSSKKQDRSTKVPVAPVQLQSSSVDQAVASPPSSPSPCVQASTLWCSGQPRSLGIASVRSNNAISTAYTMNDGSMMNTSHDVITFPPTHRADDGHHYNLLITNI